MMDALERRLRILEDIESIRRLKARYCQACDDDHNPDTVAACFVEDGVWEGPTLGVHAKGRAAIRTYIGGVRESGRMRHSAHMVTNPIIEVDGDTATGQWRLLMMYTTRPVDGKVEHHRIIGKYDEVYVRKDGAWLLERLSVTVEENGMYASEAGQTHRP
jgi:uncharacterized protein (TIGR02246 family)